MNTQALNLIALSEGIMHAVRRRRSLGPRHAKQLAKVLLDAAGSLERKHRRVETLTAIVREVAPARLTRRKRT